MSPFPIALICFSRSWGGLEIMVTKIASGLSKAGYKIVLVSPSGSPVESEASRLGLPHVAITPRFRYLDPGVIGDLGRLFRQRRIAVAVATISRDIGTVVLAARFSPATRVAYVQQMQFGHQKRDLFHRWSYGALDAWITLTHAMKASVVKNTIVKEEQIHVIPFGTDTTVFNPQKVTRRLGRRMFKLRAGALYAGFIGRLDRQKGCDEFIRAAAIVRKSIRGAQFILAGEETRGEPGYAQHLRNLRDSLDLQHHVQFLPFTREVPAFLASLDILAVPSYSETFGYVAVEGMAMGIPVIGTNSGGLPEIIVDGKTGFLIPPGDHEALAEAIITLFKKPALRKVMGNLGRQRVKQHFEFQNNIQTLDKLFQGMV